MATCAAHDRFERGANRHSVLLHLTSPQINRSIGLGVSMSALFRESHASGRVFP
jgi:hypothetical protein